MAGALLALAAWAVAPCTALAPSIVDRGRSATAALRHEQCRGGSSTALRSTYVEEPATWAPTAPPLQEFNEAKLAPYEALRGPFEREKVLSFIANRPQDIAARAVKVAATLRRATKEWAREEVPLEKRSAALRDAVASLGPVATKVRPNLSSHRRGSRFDGDRDSSSRFGDARLPS